MIGQLIVVTTSLATISLSIAVAANTVSCSPFVGLPNNQVRCRQLTKSSAVLTEDDPGQFLSTMGLAWVMRVLSVGTFGVQAICVLWFLLSCGACTWGAICCNPSMSMTTETQTVTKPSSPVPALVHHQPELDEFDV